MPHPDHEKNRISWNDMVEVHFKHRDHNVREFIDGYNSLHRIEQEKIGDVAGKTLLHLQCQFGMDTLSWARKGAIVTGVDISDNSIIRANQLKEMAGLEADFVRCDVLDLIGAIDRKFDIIFQSYGAYMWLSDMNRLARVVAHYLKPGGLFYIIDQHPITAVFDDDYTSYFQDEPLRYSNSPDYMNRDHIIKTELVEHQHTLSTIINAFIDAGLIIEKLREYDSGYYPVTEEWYEKDGSWYPPGGPPKYPLMFSLKVRKSL